MAVDAQIRMNVCAEKWDDTLRARHSHTLIKSVLVYFVVKPVRDRCCIWYCEHLLEVLIDTH